MNSFGAALPISILSGLFTAAWGAYKDAPYEGFDLRSFVRSPLFSVAIIATLYAAPTLHLAAVQVFFLVMGIERIAIEIYKPCFRREDQTKYLIPQDMSFGGLHVDSALARTAIGIVLVTLTIGVVSLRPVISSYPQHCAVSVLTGLFICCGGAGKDAPYEGFHARKFLRSALVLAAVSPLVYLLGPAPLGIVIFINGGLERLIVESYKTYFTPHPPGKFRRDLPIIDRAFLRHRRALRTVAFAIVAIVGVLYVSAVARP
jgi:hypothetical protein